MSTLNQIREGLTQAWDTLAEGWYDLRERASHALTRFHPKPATGELQKEDEQIIQQALRRIFNRLFLIAVSKFPAFFFFAS